MNHKSSKRRTRRRRLDPKKFAVLLSVVLLMGMTVGGSLAYLATQSQRVKNTFVPGHVDCIVHPGSGNTFTIEPDSETNTDVYIRAAVVVNWVKDGKIHWDAPAFTVSGKDWSESGGFYYYVSQVAPDGETAPFTVTLTSENLSDYDLQIEVVAEAIQAAADAKANAWD